MTAEPFLLHTVCLPSAHEPSRWRWTMCQEPEL